MGIVIIGGHDRMKKIYENKGKELGCKLKVFTYNMPNLEKCIGCPQYVIMFTDVVSHKMAKVAVSLCKKKKIPCIRVHNSSLNALENTLQEVLAR